MHCLRRPQICRTVSLRGVDPHDLVRGAEKSCQLRVADDQNRNRRDIGHRKDRLSPQGSLSTSTEALLMNMAIRDTG